jgi:diguanylate cyclase (GGDEF)-like protein/PAS domain S-box-containing protein
VTVAPLHRQEARRLAALRQLGVLDTGSEERFDRLTELASIVTGSPIALVSLVDEHRQWFKSKIGIDDDETPRTDAVCAHAIVSDDEMFVIDDLTADPRFADNALVVGAPEVRSYAGRVVRDIEGLPMGTLCVLDHRPRHLTDEQRRALEHIGTLVEQELRRADSVRTADSTDLQLELEQALRRSERFARVTLDALDQGTVLADRGGRIRHLNPAAERILGYPAEQLTTMWQSGDWRVFDVHGHELPAGERPIARAVLEGRPVREELIGWQRADGKRVLLRLTVVPNVDEAGAVVIGFTDVTSEYDAHRLLDATLETAPVGLVIINADRKIVRCNATFARHAGRDLEDLTGCDVLSLLHADDLLQAARIGQAMRDGERAHAELEQRVDRPDGTEMWVSTHLAVISDVNPPLAIAATFDVTERKQMILQLSRFEHLFEHANDLIIVVSDEGQVKYASPSTIRMLGYPRGFRRTQGILGVVHDDDLESAIETLRKIADDEPVQQPFLIRARDYRGEWHHIECVGVNLLDDPAVNGIVITARDATERERLASQLAHRATHDTLTNLVNRGALEAALSDTLQRAPEGAGVGVCFIDLDGFKAVNDTLGHASGDELLVAIADRINQAVRATDTAARMGGDEFVVLLDPVVGPADAFSVATRIRDAIVALSQRWSDKVEFGASVGVAISATGDTPSTLLSRADAALYRAKSYGGSAIEIALEGEFLSSP